MSIAITDESGASHSQKSRSNISQKLRGGADFDIKSVTWSIDSPKVAQSKNCFSVNGGKAIFFNPYISKTIRCKNVLHHC